MLVVAGEEEEVQRAIANRKHTPFFLMPEMAVALAVGGDMVGACTGKVQVQKERSSRAQRERATDPTEKEKTRRNYLSAIR